MLPAPEVFEWQSVRRELMQLLLPAGHTLEGQRMRGSSGAKDNPSRTRSRAALRSNGIILDARRTAGFEPDIVARSKSRSISSSIRLPLAFGVGPRPPIDRRAARPRRCQSMPQSPSPRCSRTCYRPAGAAAISPRCPRLAGPRW